MPINMTGRVRNYIFLVLSVITILSLFIAKSIANQRNIPLIRDYIVYQQALDLVDQNSFDKAEPLLNDLIKKYPDSHMLLLSYSRCLIQDGKLTEATEYLQKSREINPLLTYNTDYLVQYGTLLFKLGDYSKADQYFDQSKKMLNNPEKINELSQYIALLKKEKNS